jgi:hypothetical protein
MLVLGQIIGTQLALHIPRGPDPLQMARDWRKKNWTAYEQLVEWAREDIEHGARPSIKLYFELLRRPHFAHKLGLHRDSPSVLLNNNLHADLARLLNEHYDLGFPTRRAKADDWNQP